METYPVDIDPGQVVRWIKAECEVAPSRWRVTHGAAEKSAKFRYAAKRTLAMKNVRI